MLIMEIADGKEGRRINSDIHHDTITPTIQSVSYFPLWYTISFVVTKGREKDKE